MTVIDGTGASPKTDMIVIVSGERITAVGRSRRLAVPRKAQVVDARDMLLIPGLWDMHVHLGNIEREFPLFAANGVTGVRNMGGILDDLRRWRGQTTTGRVLGPRIIARGSVRDGPNPAHPEHAVVVTSEREGRQAVIDLKARRADFAKVYDGVPREAYFAIAEEARNQHFPFGGHVPNAVGALEATNAGQKSIEHLGGIFEGASRMEEELRKQLMTPTKPGDFASIPDRIATRGTQMLDTYNEEKAARLFAQFAKNGTWQAPTLTRSRVPVFIDDENFTNDPRLRYSLRQSRNQGDPKNQLLFKFRTPKYIAFRKRLYTKQPELVRAMHKAGVPFMAGTDTGDPYLFPGFSLHDELALLVQTGFTPMEAIQAATSNPAKYLGISDSVGTVPPDKLANLVLLDADPLLDIKNSGKIAAVVLRGKYLARAELNQMLARVEAEAKGK